MRKSIPTLCATICATVFCACVRPVITKRYRTQVQVQVPNNAIEARLTAFSLDVPVVSAHTTLLNLGERGQASLIQELGKKSKDAGELLEKLGAPIRAPRDPGQAVDHTVFERRVVFSIDNLSPGPADRITQARIRLAMLTPTAKFKNWTQFATKYETADLGSLKFTQNRELNFDLTMSPTKIAKAEAQGKASNALEEDLKLIQRYVSVTGALAPDGAQIVQQGSPGTDVVGNVAVDFTIEIHSSDHTDTFSFEHLFDGTGKPKPADAVVFTRQTVKFVPSSVVNDILAQGTLTATIRHVTYGDDTFIESDDDVEFRTGTAPSVDVTLVPKELLQFSVWMLRDGSGKALHIKTSSGSPEPIQLASFDEAIELRDYLAGASNPAAIAGRSLCGPDGTPLDANKAKSLQVQIEKLNW